MTTLDQIHASKYAEKVTLGEVNATREAVRSRSAISYGFLDSYVTQRAHELFPDRAICARTALAYLVAKLSRIPVSNVDMSAIDRGMATYDQMLAAGVPMSEISGHFALSEAHILGALLRGENTGNFSLAEQFGDGIENRSSVGLSIAAAKAMNVLLEVVVAHVIARCQGQRASLWDICKTLSKLIQSSRPRVNP